jgi:hypothetical protein
MVSKPPPPQLPRQENISLFVGDIINLTISLSLSLSLFLYEIDSCLKGQSSNGLLALKHYLCFRMQGGFYKNNL